MSVKTAQDARNSLSVSWDHATRFIRQLSHDLRNDLNAIELQSAYIGELEQNEEVKDEIKRLREMVAGLASTLQRLSRTVAEVTPNLIPYRAADLVEDLRIKIERDFTQASSDISWEIQVGGTTLNVDPQLLEEAFLELFANAFRHDRDKGSLLAQAEIDNDQFRFCLHEPKRRFELPTQNWGREPLQNTSHRHYGLGLNRVRAIVEAHGGELHARYDPHTSALITMLSLPISGASAK